MLLLILLLLLLLQLLFPFSPHKTSKRILYLRWMPLDIKPLMLLAATLTWSSSAHFSTWRSGDCFFFKISTPCY